MLVSGVYVGAAVVRTYAVVRGATA